MNCTIVLNNPSGRFLPGEVVRGKIVWVLEDSVDIKGIQIIFRGEERTSWKTYENYYDDVYKETKYGNVEYTGYKEFLNSDINVVAEGIYGPRTLEYPFNFTLPPDCPSTYRTQHGDIRYYIKLIIDQALPPNYEKKLDLFIVAPINFNNIPHLVLNPAQYEGQNSLCCFYCWAQGSVVMKLYMEKEAYILGDLIKFTVHIDNRTPENVMYLKTKLKMTIKETATNPRLVEKYTEEILATAHDYNFDIRHSENKICESSLLIPLDIELPNFSSCSLLQTWCNLQVEAVISCCHDNVILKPKIMLGHIARGDGIETTEAVYRKLLNKQIGVHRPTSVTMPLPITSPPSSMRRPEIGLLQQRETTSAYPPSCVPLVSLDPVRIPERAHILTPSDERDEESPPSYFEAVYAQQVKPPPHT